MKGGGREENEGNYMFAYSITRRSQQAESEIPSQFRTIIIPEAVANWIFTCLQSSITTCVIVKEHNPYD